MAEWLYREGMKGTFAFDVAVTRKGVGTDYLAIECNPRFNGASYPTVIAHKLGLESWVARASPPATAHSLFCNWPGSSTILTEARV